MSDIKFEILKKLDNSFVEKWQSVWDNQSGAHFFNSPDWFMVCLQSFGIKNYSVFVGYRNEQIKVILPMVEVKKFGIKFLASPGGKYLDKNSLLLADNNKQALWKIIEKTSKYANIYLAEVNSDVKEQSPKNIFFKEASVNPYISLDENPFRFLPKKQKRDLLRRIRKYKDFELKVYGVNLQEHLSTIFNIEKQSYKRKKGRHIFDNLTARKLYDQISKNSGKALVAILHFQDKPISHMFGLVYKNVFMAYHMAYLEEYKKLVPGKILLMFLLIKLKEEGFKMFDFSRGDSLLKQQFSQQKKIQYDIYVIRNRSVRLYINSILLIQESFKNVKKDIKLFYQKIKGG